MSDEVTLNELHRRQDRLEKEMVRRFENTVSSEAFDIVSHNQHHRIQRLENSLTWAFRFMTVTALTLIVEMVAFIFYIYGGGGTP